MFLTRRRSLVCVCVFLCLVGLYTVYHHVVSTLNPKQNHSVSDSTSSIHSLKLQTGAIHSQNLQTGNGGRIVTNDSVDQTHVKNVTKGALDDYQTFPCVSGIVPSQELKTYGSCVRTISKDINEDAVNGPCVSLKIMQATPICVYESKKDKFVSGAIIQTGQFEGGMVKGLMTVLAKTPKMEFLDLGCNIGVYTISAAKLGKRVVSVDPLTENIRMVSKSLNLGKIHENVTLIWNAVSDYYSIVSFTKYDGNVGGTAIKPFDNSARVNDNDAARTIRLDDLTSLFEGKQIIIKMDVETQELAVLKGGQLFFKHVDVQLIQMEFNWHKNKPSGKDIIDFMEERKLLPFQDLSGTKSLEKAKYSSWPGDIYFVKQNGNF